MYCFHSYIMELWGSGDLPQRHKTPHHKIRMPEMDMNLKKEFDVKGISTNYIAVNSLYNLHRDITSYDCTRAFSGAPTLRGSRGSHTACTIVKCIINLLQSS